MLNLPCSDSILNIAMEMSNRQISKLLKDMPCKVADDIEGVYTEQMAVSEKIVYKQGFQDGINLLLELIGEKQTRLRGSIIL